LPFFLVGWLAVSQQWRHMHNTTHMNSSQTNTTITTLRTFWCVTGLLEVRGRQWESSHTSQITCLDAPPQMNRVVHVRPFVYWCGWHTLLTDGKIYIKFNYQ
jgi:hypothetical protein